MPLYMDVHHLDGPVTVDDVAKAHMADLQMQDKYDVQLPALLGRRGQQHDLLPRRGAVPGRRQHRAPRGPRPGRRRDPRGQGGFVMSVRTTSPRSRGRRRAGRRRACSRRRRSGHRRDRRPGRDRAPATHTFTHPTAAKKAGYGLLKDANGIACIAHEGHGRDGRALRQRRRWWTPRSSSVTPRPWSTASPTTATSGSRRSSTSCPALWRQDHPTGRPSLFGHRFTFTPAGNRFGLPAFFSLHAWVWYKNPAGDFPMWNPRVHCPAGI